MRFGVRWELTALLALLAACSEGSPTPDDAGPPDSGAACPSYVVPDADGDGFGTAPALRVECGESTPPGHVPVTAGSDCDDADASVWRWVGEDRDGDGHLAGNEPTCLGSELPQGWGTGSFGDCDDSDPTTFARRYRDADGDGDGDGAQPLCLGETHAPGTSVIGRDCDDADPARHTFAPEQFADGIDSNCDAEDDPVACPNDRAACVCEWREAVLPVPTQSCADAPDLYIERLDACMTCGPEQLLVAVGNRGGGAGEVGAVAVTLTDTGDGRRTDIPPAPIPLARALAPGQVIAPLLLPLAWPIERASLIGVPSDCDATNDAVELSQLYAECF